MPVTPLHYSVAYFVYRISGKLSLPGLIVGSMIPDLEVPFMRIAVGPDSPNRMILHSLLGSATLGTFLAVIVTISLYPFVVNRFFNVDKKKLEKKCKLSFVLVFSVLLGNILHVLLDFLNHPFNPIFWPFRSAVQTHSPIYFALPTPIRYLWIQIVMGVFLLLLILVKRKNLFEELLVG